MLPLFLFIAFRPRRGGIRWWLPIPLFLIWILLLPLVLVLLPFAILALLAVQMNPVRTLALFWNTLSSLAGTDIEIDDGKMAFRVLVV